MVLRLLCGESLAAVSREVGVEVYRLEAWKTRALAGLVPEPGQHARRGGGRRGRWAGGGGSPEGERRPRPSAHVAGPVPRTREVPATVQRRRFSAAYRLRILKAVDACKKPGEVGALLRREGLYSSLLTNWRRQREAGAAAPRRPAGDSARGGEPPAAAEVAARGDDHHALKKFAEILGLPLTPLDDDETD